MKIFFYERAVMFGAICLFRSLIDEYFYAELWIMYFFSPGILLLNM